MTQERIEKAQRDERVKRAVAASLSDFDDRLKMLAADGPVAVLPGGEVVGIAVEIAWCHSCLALRGRDCTDQKHKVSWLYRLVADKEDDDE